MLTISRFFSICYLFCQTLAFTPIAFATDVETTAKRCMGCHGPKGAGGNPAFPILAGQRPDYLTKQLQAFKQGNRDNSTMQAVAAGLNDTDIKALASYFAKQSATATGDGSAENTSGGDKAAQCLGCHGTKAQGNASIPKLAGQHRQYLIKQLKAFKNGSRSGGPMSTVARSLSDQDIEDIAAYLAGL